MSGWLVFKSRTTAAIDRQARPTHKLYVSVLGGDVVVAVERIVACAGQLDVLAFKVACDAVGLARPDKLVVYLPSEDALRKVCAALRGELAGLEAQGVPFSSPVDEVGLLSWGMDPPASAEAGGTPRSWRDWVTRRLAIALHEENVRSADAEGCDGRGPARAVEAALLRLELDGVDVTQWRPDPSIWGQ